MKKLIFSLLLATLLAMLAIPAMAADAVVAYTGNSSFDVGGTVKVDESRTKHNIMDLGKDAAEYNAALEGNMQYYWFRNDTYYADGTSITLTENDKGCQFYCKVFLFSDADRTQQCGVYDSAKFTVPNTNHATIPDITTKDLPNGTVGEEYYQKLSCTDDDVVYTLFRSSLPDGLYLTQHGEIEGTPTKAGFWYVVIMVTPEAGADYANTKEFEITIDEKEEYTLEIEQLPNKLIYTAGEKLDMTGLWVRIYTPDGFIDSRNGEKLTYFQDELLNTGERKIKISYGEAFTFFYVTVNEGTIDPTESTTPTEPVDPTEPPEEGTTTPTEVSTEPSNGDEAVKPTIYETDEKDAQRKAEMPWWGILLIALGAAGASAGIVLLIIKKKP